MKSMNLSIISKALNDPRSAKVLVSCIGDPLTAMDIAEHLGMSMSDCYNSIRKLINAGLIRCCDVRTLPSGRKVRAYISTVERLNITMEYGKMTCVIERPNGGKETMAPICSDEP